MTTRQDHWAALDGLRGIAVLLVLLYHFGAPLGSGGYVGVDVFFVISGCVVAASLRRSATRGEALSEFFQRRAARLLPNLLTLLLAVLVWDIWREHRLVTASNMAVLTGLAQVYNVVPADGVATRHLWSLSEEWQFYLLLPLLLSLLCWRVAWAAPAAMTLAAASALSRPLLRIVGGATVGHVYLWPFARLDGLLLGVSVALLLEQKRRLSNRMLTLAAEFSVLAIALFAPRWYSSPDVSLFYVLPAVSVGAFVVVWAVTSSDPTALVNRVLAFRGLRYIGERSYSIYLWHYFVGVAIIGQGDEVWRGAWIFLQQAVVSLVVAIAAYEMIEHPARVRLNRLIARHRLGRQTRADPRPLIAHPR